MYTYFLDVSFLSTAEVFFPFKRIVLPFAMFLAYAYWICYPDAEIFFQVAFAARFVFMAVTFIFFT